MKQTLLVVDDDVDALHLLCLILEKQGFSVVSATDGSEAIQKAIQEKPDLILMDVTMPGKDGFEVTKLMKSDEKLAHIPIIMLTAKGDIDDKLYGFEAGVDDYLTKPIQPKELIAHVQAVLTRNQRKHELKGALPRLQRAYTIGLIAAKGGLGCSTLSLALGLLLREMSDREVIVAEYRPGQGSLGYILKVDDPLRIPQLFDIPLADLTNEHIENILFHYSLPTPQDEDSKNKEIRLLLSSSHPGESKYIHQTELYKMITHLLSKICGFLILDLGTSLNPIAEKTLEQCDELIVITDTVDYTVRQTKALIHALNSYGFNGNKVEVFVHNARSATLSGYTAKKEELKYLNQYASLFVLEHLSTKEIEEYINLPIYYNDDGFPTYWKAVKHLANRINERVSLSIPLSE